MSFPTSGSEIPMTQPNSIFLETADSIGARLCSDALWAGERCNWLGDSMEPIGNNWTVVHRTFGPELYNGTSGIALFLTRLFAETQERPYRVTAQGAMRHAMSRLDDIPSPMEIGFYSGLTGIAYTLLDLSETFDNPDYNARAFRILEDLARSEPIPEALDVVGGSAGAIPALLNIHRRYPKDMLLDLAVRHGEYLLNNARRTNIGWSWTTLSTPYQEKQRDLTGFAHGAAGIAWALLELYRQTGEERFRSGAEQGFRYEQHWYNPRYGNWPDFRNLFQAAGGDKTPTYMVAWCHGAPGIGLSRLRAYEILDQGYLPQAQAAIQTTANMLQQMAPTGQCNYSLCHGLAGNAELLVYAAQVLGNDEYKALADQVGQRGIEFFRNNGAPWPCGVSGGGETPNLMLGLAGIGHFYLRLYDPTRIPSVLMVI